MTKDELIKLKEEILKLKDSKKITDLLPKQTAYSFLYENNIDRMDKYAINYFGRKYTYNELFMKIDECAKAYSELGIKKGDMVAMSMLMTPEAIISFYALNKIGAVAHLVNITHNISEVENTFINTKSKYFITHDLFYTDKIKNVTDKVGVKKVIISSLDDSLFKGLDTDRIKIKLINLLKGNSKNCKDEKCIKWKKLQEIGKRSSININNQYEENAPIAIAYTSGSTGLPKAIVTTNKAFNSLPLQLGMTDQTFMPNDSIFTTMPTWIYYSLVNNMHNPLCLGVTLDLDPLFDSKKIHKRIKQYKFNHWNTIPAYVDGLAHDKKIKNMDLSFLKSITTGGDFLTTKLKETAEKKLKQNNSDIYIGQGYGASELLGSFCYTYEKNMSPNSIGKPLVGNRFKILDLNTGKELGPNESGELYLYSPSLMKEYYKNEEATNKSIIVDKDGIRWYKTEDVAHYNENGELFIDGRLRRIELSKDDQGNPAKVFPDKIKQIILQHSIVEKCEVIMVPDTIKVKKPVAFLQLKEHELFDDDLSKQITDICIKNHVENYSLPYKYIVIDEIPLTPALKPDFNAMQELYQQEVSNKKIKALKR